MFNDKEVDFLMQGLELLEDDFDVNAEYYETLREKLRCCYNNNIDSLLKQEDKIHDEILKKIEQLKNYGTDCHCNIRDREKYTYLFFGEYPEIISVCLKCGGNIYDR
jgi:hypothetical protein